MTDAGALDRFLRTDPADIGCDQALAALHVYVDVVVEAMNRGASLEQATASATSRFPGVTSHLLACGPCHDDYSGLLRAVTSG